jgi:IS30 family transposase
MAKDYTHLTRGERVRIRALRTEHKSLGFIANALGRAKSTICEELRRNQYRGSLYVPLMADSMARKRRKQPRRERKMACPSIRTVVEEGLGQQWSPEQIAGRLRKRHPRSPQRWISHEAIYQWIWRDRRAGGSWYKHLRQSNRKLKKRRTGREMRGRIEGRIGIEARPASVDSRRFIGDWEGDTVVGSGRQAFVATWTERKTRYTCLAPLVDKRVETLNAAILARFAAEPHLPMRTTTLDNGREFFGHAKLAKAWRAKIYFARPYHSWERGLNENTNGLLRQYFPKRTMAQKIPPERIAQVEKLLNNRPRKTLNYRTPAEVMASHLLRPPGVRLRP